MGGLLLKYCQKARPKIKEANSSRSIKEQPIGTFAPHHGCDATQSTVVSFSHQNVVLALWPGRSAL